MKKVTFLSALALTAILCLPLGARAEEKPAKPAATEKAAKADKPIEYHGTVDAVDKAAKTFTFKETAGERVFTVTDATKIENTVTKKAATFDDIEVGAYITGSYYKKADSLEAHSVHLGKKAPVKGEKKAKADKSAPADKPADKPATPDAAPAK